METTRTKLDSLGLWKMHMLHPNQFIAYSMALIAPQVWKYIQMCENVISKEVGEIIPLQI